MILPAMQEAILRELEAIRTGEGPDGYLTAGQLMGLMHEDGNHVSLFLMLRELSAMRDVGLVSESAVGGVAHWRAA
jgi:hypothetical protein